MIIHNLSRFEESQAELLRHPTVIDDLLVMTGNRQIRTLATMAVANLVGKDEFRSELLRSAKTGALRELAALFEGVLSHGAFDYNTFVLSEPLLPLRYLSIPKNNRKILGPLILDMLPRALSKALETNDHESAEHCIAILSQFALDADSLPRIRKFEDVASMLETIVSQAEATQEWRQAGHDARGLLWTLNGGDAIEGTGVVKAR
jgi:hypothetical protein